MRKGTTQEVHCLIRFHYNIIVRLKINNVTDRRDWKRMSVQTDIDVFSCAELLYYLVCVKCEPDYCRCHDVTESTFHGIKVDREYCRWQFSNSFFS